MKETFLYFVFSPGRIGGAPLLTINEEEALSEYKKWAPCIALRVRAAELIDWQGECVWSEGGILDARKILGW